MTNPTLDIEAIKSGLPEEPWTYRKSIPTDGFECFIVEAADGSVVIEVPGPQNERQENLAKRIASIPAMSAENERMTRVVAQIQPPNDVGDNLTVELAVKCAEQEVEIERLRAENADLREKARE
jgi:hypothetical protein